MSALIWRVSFFSLAFLIAISAAIVVVVSGDPVGHRAWIGVMAFIVAGFLVIVGAAWPPNRFHAAAVAAIAVASAVAIYAVPYRSVADCSLRAPCDPVLDAQTGIRVAIFIAGAMSALWLAAAAWRRSRRESGAYVHHA